MPSAIQGCAAFLLALTLGVVPVLAADTPTEAVAAIYGLEAKGIDLTSAKGKSFRPNYLTPSFQRVLASIDEREDGTGEAVLDFDPILSTNGDADAAELTIAVTSETGDRAVVTATFGRGKDRRSVAYDMRRENDVWLIDDIRGVPAAGQPDAWSVRKISDDDLAARAGAKP